jgi:hypothetical protein
MNKWVDYWDVIEKYNIDKEELFEYYRRFIEEKKLEKELGQYIINKLPESFFEEEEN